MERLIRRIACSLAARCLAGVILCLFMAIAVAGDCWSQDVPLVTGIDVKGLRRIEEGAIRTKLSQKIKEPLSQTKTTEDIKAIYKMGYFEDVRVEIEPFEGGIKAIYIVKEKPTIVKVEFQGNNEFDDAKLREKITVTPGSIADITLVNDNTLRLKAFYEDEGYYLATVVPVVGTVREGEVLLTFVIDEKDKVKIREIRIEGAKALPEKKVKGIMKTGEYGTFSFITKTGYYRKEEMRADIERIRDLYYDNGYIKVVVSEPVLQMTDDRKGMKIAVKVSEGDQYKVSSVDVAGNKIYTDDELRKIIKLTPGGVFSKSVLRGDVTSISDLYSNGGYALVSVSPDLVPDDTKNVAKVIYRINEGAKYRVGKVEIAGNTKTRDKVIRREIRLDEGDVFSAAALKRSYERLNNLNFFETVDISPKPKVDEKVVDLDVKVKEKPTGFISIGGGYSSIDGVIGIVDVTQGNLFGLGQYLRARGELGGKSSYFDLAFRDPWFLDKQLSFGVNVYHANREYPAFTKKATGGSITFGKSFWEYYTSTVTYNLEFADVYKIADNASLIVKDQAGKNTTSSITLTTIRDTRDNYLDPMRGSRNLVAFTFAGLGGTNAFIKARFDSAWYFPITAATTFHARGRIGYATGIFGETLPLYERFYVGGIYTVRGFDWGGAGPKDPNTGEPIGGEKELIFNLEYIFPIISEYKVKGVVFSDVGRAYDGDGVKFGQDLRYTAGLGVRWISPMGPIRIEWGYNLDKKPGESQSKIEFAFGSFF